MTNDEAEEILGQAIASEVFSEDPNEIYGVDESEQLDFDEPGDLTSHTGGVDEDYIPDVEEGEVKFLGVD